MVGIFSNKWMKLLYFSFLFVLLQSEFGYVSAARIRGVKANMKEGWNNFTDATTRAGRRMKQSILDIKIFKKKEVWTGDDQYIISVAKAVMDFKLAPKVEKIKENVCKHATVPDYVCNQDIDIYVQKCFQGEGLGECYKIPLKHIGPGGMLTVYVPHVLIFATRLFDMLRKDLRYRREMEDAKWWTVLWLRIKRFFKKDRTVRYFSDTHLKNRILNSTPKYQGGENKYGVLNDYIHYGILNIGFLIGGHHKLAVDLLQNFVSVGFFRKIFAFFLRKKLNAMGIKPIECVDIATFKDDLYDYLGKFHAKFVKLGAVYANAIMGGYVNKCAAMRGEGEEGPVQGGEGEGEGEGQGEEGLEGGNEGGEGGNEGVTGAGADDLGMGGEGQGMGEGEINAGGEGGAGGEGEE